MKEALVLAEDMVASLDSCVTRASARNVKSVDNIKGRVATRSNGNNSGYYLINYDDNQGFAIVSSYKCDNPVFAFSNEGNLNLSDTASNLGLAAYLNSLPDNSVQGTGGDPNPTGSDSIVTNTMRLFAEPLLTQTVQDWDQTTYPMKSPGSSHDANCVAVACAQIMSFYEHPKKYDGTVIDWQGIKNGTNKSQSNWLISQLGLAKNLNIGIEDNDCYPEETLNQTLSNFGYTSSGSWLYTSSNSITDAMYVNNERRPMWCRVIIDTDSTGRPKYYHVFCIDGFLRIIEECYPSNNPDSKWTQSDDTYFHVVWGYGRNGNGYFRINGSHIGGEAYQWDTTTPRYWGPYQSLLFITGMLPK